MLFSSPINFLPFLRLGVSRVFAFPLVFDNVRFSSACVAPPPPLLLSDPKSLYLVFCATIVHSNIIVRVTRAESLVVVVVVFVVMT